MPDRTTNENKAVEAYLAYLATGLLPEDPDKTAKLVELQGKIDAEERLHVKVVLLAQRETIEATHTTAKDLEDRFLNYGATFGERNRIPYKAWRAMGVPPRVLQAMGLKGTPYKHRDPGQPPVDGRGGKPRHKRDAEFAEAVFTLYFKEGREAIAERYGYNSTHSVTTVLYELFRKFPDIAKAHGYDHKAETITKTDSLARAHAASSRAAAERKAS